MPKHASPTTLRKKSTAAAALPKQQAVFETHDHTTCIRQALMQAERRCDERAAQLTPLRRQVLALVLNVHQPLGAYDLLEQLAQQTQKRVAPPTVYRALDFLVEMGLVHRIASLNAYLACTRFDDHGETVFFICSQCRTTMEINSSDISSAISNTAKKAHFIAERQTVEVLGICPQCQNARATKSGSNT